MTTGYKIVDTYGGKMRSAIISLMGLYYEKGKTTTRLAGCGPMAVFDALDCAADWWHSVNWMNELQVWAVEYEPSEDKDFWIVYNPDGPIISQRNYAGTRGGYPRGTCFADAVTLMRRVTPAE